MLKTIKIIIFGFLIWLIPFLISMPFYKNGQPAINIFTIKTLMIFTGTFITAILLILLFKKQNNNFLLFGITVGIIWFIINIILDLLLLVPMMKIPISSYFLQIGFRYLNMIIMSVSFGYIIECIEKRKRL